MDAETLQALAVRTLFVVPLLIASLADLTSYRIPNPLPLALVVLFPAAQTFAPQPVEWLPHLSTAAAVLVAGFVLFLPGLIGGGDAKLLAATALWLGPGLMPADLLLVGVTGGLLAVAVVALRAANLPWRIALLKRNGQVPYGLAIAASGIVLSGQLPMLG